MNISREATRILIVEDTPELLHILREILTPHYTVLLAKNGSQALDLIGREPAPDLVLLDVLMPGIDGFEVCRQIKSVPNRSGIPIIFLTGKTGSESVVHGFELGASDYITKPFNQPELLARVRAHIELKRSRDTIAAQNVERGELVHILSHDLTNTFTAINGIIEFMKAGLGDPGELVGELAAVNRNGIALIELVRQMRRLDEKPLEVKAVGLASAVAESLRLLAGPIGQKGMTVDSQVGEELRIMAEKTSLVNSVLNNLLTNSIKFSHPGSVIHIRAVAERDWVRVSVRDQGIGMPPRLLRQSLRRVQADEPARDHGRAGHRIRHAPAEQVRPGLRRHDPGVLHRGDCREARTTERRWSSG